MEKHRERGLPELLPEDVRRKVASWHRPCAPGIFGRAAGRTFTAVSEMKKRLAGWQGMQEVDNDESIGNRRKRAAGI